MLKVVLLGAGNHSEHVHGPSLAHYAKEHPGEIALAAVCDLSEERGQLFREKFGFARAYVDLEEMFDREKPDACWVVAPLPKTRELAGRVMERGIPVLFEKPPGANLREAQELASISARTLTPNMVAFNRRWAPCTKKALAWAKEHGPFEFIYSRMLRVNRLDDEFAFGTGIHVLDCTRYLAEAVGGGIASARVTRVETAAGHYNFHVDFTLRNGMPGRCDILPTCGMLEESYALFGSRASISAPLPWNGARTEDPLRCELWVDGKVVESEGLPADPMYLSCGFYQETEEFIAALQEGRRPTPSAEEAVDSVALAVAVQEGRDISF
jgi:myo-inositol 2-dehydrogenase / D-chiro-inositol 1-dehydrogenase